LDQAIFIQKFFKIRRFSAGKQPAEKAEFSAGGMILAKPYSRGYLS
jgi:hypothetical protein